MIRDECGSEVAVLCPHSASMVLGVGLAWGVGLRDEDLGGALKDPSDKCGLQRDT